MFRRVGLVMLVQLVGIDDYVPTDRGGGGWCPGSEGMLSTLGLGVPLAEWSQTCPEATMAAEPWESRQVPGEGQGNGHPGNLGPLGKFRPGVARCRAGTMVPLRWFGRLVKKSPLPQLPWWEMEDLRESGSASLSGVCR